MAAAASAIADRAYELASTGLAELLAMADNDPDLLNAAMLALARRPHPKDARTVSGAQHYGALLLAQFARDFLRAEPGP